ncbi:MAG: type II secretion system protein [Candidatus Colwellbacteria bacterium]|nr:type II secretion system protein [Candidatus Colwellbacteria bacterium]
MNHRKGFTLIELLIVIGILGILAAAVVVVLNPGELLAQARDSSRISDMDSVRSAISLYLSDVASPTLTAGPFSTNDATCGLGAGTCTVRNLYGIDGSGWAGVDLSAISGGSPLSGLPRDPTNNANYQYAYAGDNTNKTFELNARLESQKHRGKMTTDGGNQSTCSTWTEATCYYEIGSDPGLNL